MNKLSYAILTQSNELLKENLNNMKSFLIPMGDDPNCIEALPIFNIMLDQYFYESISIKDIKKILNYNLKYTDDFNKFLTILLSSVKNEHKDEYTHLILNVAFDNLLKNIDLYEKNNKEYSKKLSIMLNKIHHIIEMKQNTLTKKIYFKLFKIIKKISVENFDEDKIKYGIQSYINLFKVICTELKYSKNIYKKEMFKFLIKDNIEIEEKINYVNLKKYNISKNDAYILKNVIFNNYYKLLLINDDKVFKVEGKNYLLFLKDYEEFLKEETKQNEENDLKYKEENFYMDTFINFSSIFDSEVKFKDKDFALYYKTFNEFVENISKNKTKEELIYLNYELSPIFNLLEFNNFKYYDKIFKKYSHIILMLLEHKHFISNEESIKRIWNSLREKNLINIYNVESYKKYTSISDYVGKNIKLEFEREVVNYEKNIINKSVIKKPEQTRVKQINKI